MAVLLIALAAGASLLIAYRTYGKWLSAAVFQLDPNANTPATALEDGADFVPTRRSIVFGHHFTSIAGVGPIVGPAIAIMWGWVPALLWVILGSIFVGAVHDLGSLVVSLRSKGRSIGDVAGDLLGPRVRLIFLWILAVGLWIVLAIFGLVIATVLKQFPRAITPVLIQIPIAIAIGVLIHRKGRSIVLPSIIALTLLLTMIVLGDAGPLHALNIFLAAQPIWIWTIALLAYCYIASVLPVWTLLQPRDYINALQLLTGIALLVLGLFAAAFLGASNDAPLAMAAPAIDLAPTAGPPIIPMLFITIACGACSGFHCLVASGTTSKQLTCESHAKPIGYGSMLTEGFLATLVIVACGAGLGLGIQQGGATLLGVDAFNARYANWNTASSLPSTVGSFVEGSANLIASLGIPIEIAIALMAVMVASFAATTLDTSCRLQRYVIQEIAKPRQGRTPTPPRRWAASTHGATTLAVLTAICLSMWPRPAMWSSIFNGGATLHAVLDDAGKGAMLLWPMFGATNQLLAGFALAVVFVWLATNHRKRWFLAPPTVLMLAMPAAALVYQAFIGIESSPSWLSKGEWHLVAVSALALALEAWLVLELFTSKRNKPVSVPSKT